MKNASPNLVIICRLSKIPHFHVSQFHLHIERNVFNNNNDLSGTFSLGLAVKVVLLEMHCIFSIYNMNWHMWVVFGLEERKKHQHTYFNIII